MDHVRARGGALPWREGPEPSALDGRLLRAGTLADLVLLSWNPMEDITPTRSIQAVVTKGKLLDRAAVDALVR